MFFPIKTSIYKGFSMAMLNNQMVHLLIEFQGWPWYKVRDGEFLRNRDLSETSGFCWKNHMSLPIENSYSTYTP